MSGHETPEAPASFVELERHVTTGAWDQVRLAAKYAVNRTASLGREFLESGKAVWRGEDPASYYIGREQRKTDMLHDLGRWAVEKGMVAEGQLEPRLPRYERPI
jgi:hypothetical protein